MCIPGAVGPQASYEPPWNSRTRVKEGLEGEGQWPYLGYTEVVMDSLQHGIGGNP